MTDEVTDETAHSQPSAAAEHVTDPHGTAAAGDDEHGHEGEALGPIDWTTWGYAVAGAIAAVVVIACFVVAFGGLPA